MEGVDQRGQVRVVQRGAQRGTEVVAVAGEHHRIVQRHAQERRAVAVADEDGVRGEQRYPVDRGVPDDGGQGHPVRVALPRQRGRHVRRRLPAAPGRGQEPVQRGTVDQRRRGQPTGRVVHDERIVQSPHRVPPAHRGQRLGDRSQ